MQENTIHLRPLLRAYLLPKLYKEDHNFSLSPILSLMLDTRYSAKKLQAWRASTTDLIHQNESRKHYKSASQVRFWLPTPYPNVFWRKSNVITTTYD